MSGSCSTATYRSKRWQSCSVRPPRLSTGNSRPRHDAGARQTDCGVDGTYAKRSTVAPQSSPAAAQPGAEGAGLDGGDRGRSTIVCAVLHSHFHRNHRPDRHFRSTASLHHVGTRPSLSAPVPVGLTPAREGASLPGRTVCNSRSTSRSMPVRSSALARSIFACFSICLMCFSRSRSFFSMVKPSVAAQCERRGARSGARAGITLAYEGLAACRLAHRAFPVAPARVSQHQARARSMADQAAQIARSPGVCGGNARGSWLAGASQALHGSKAEPASTSSETAVRMKSLALPRTPSRNA